MPCPGACARPWAGAIPVRVRGTRGRAAGRSCQRLARTPPSGSSPRDLSRPGSKGGMASPPRDPGLSDEGGLDEADPSRADGSRVIYDREVPVEVRVQAPGRPAEVGSLETLRTKVLVLDGDSGRLARVAVELTSDADLFFHHVHRLDETGFGALQEAQVWMVAAGERPTCGP